MLGFDIEVLGASHQVMNHRFHGSIGSTRLGVGDSLITVFPGSWPGEDGKGSGDGAGLEGGCEGCFDLSASRFISVLRNVKFISWQLSIDLILAASQ